MIQQPRITLEDALDKLYYAATVSIYEFYDGYYVTFDGIEYMVSEDDYGEFYYLWLEAWPAIFDALPNTNLTSFEFTSRFASECDYKYFKGIPKTLKVLKLDHLTGIDIDKYIIQLRDIDITITEYMDNFEDEYPTEYTINTSEDEFEEAFKDESDEEIEEAFKDTEDIKLDESPLKILFNTYRIIAKFHEENDEATLAKKRRIKLNHTNLMHDIVEYFYQPRFIEKWLNEGNELEDYLVS